MYVFACVRKYMHHCSPHTTQYYVCTMQPAKFSCRLGDIYTVRVMKLWEGGRKRVFHVWAEPVVWCLATSRTVEGKCDGPRVCFLPLHSGFSWLCTKEEVHSHSCICAVSLECSAVCVCAVCECAVCECRCVMQVCECRCMSAGVWVHCAAG